MSTNELAQAQTPAPIARTPVVIKKPNGGFDIGHFTPQTPTQRIAVGLLQLVTEDGLRMGDDLAMHPACLAENGTQAIRILLQWAHNEVEGASQ